MSQSGARDGAGRREVEGWGLVEKLKIEDEREVGEDYKLLRERKRVRGRRKRANDYSRDVIGALVI